MRRSVRQKVVAAAAVAVVIGGGAFAAVSATGHGDRNRGAHARHNVHRLHRHDLSAAAAYLGISTAQLERELDSSKSLAQVAEAHAGKSSQGLIDAIVAARRTRLAKVSARLPSRVGAEVNGPAGLPGAHSLTVAAAGYLGIASTQLRADLRSGKTLAQVADETPGKTSAGLLDALIAARKQHLAHSVGAGKLAKSRAAHRERRLERRMNKLVQRKFVRAGKP